MKKLDELLTQIGLSKSNGLFYLKDDRWKTDTAFPNRVKRLIEKKIEPDAFFALTTSQWFYFLKTDPIGKNYIKRFGTSTSVRLQFSLTTEQ
jgi:hypothetical protein